MLDAFKTVALCLLVAGAASASAIEPRAGTKKTLNIDFSDFRLGNGNTYADYLYGKGLYISEYTADSTPSECLFDA